MVRGGLAGAEQVIAAKACKAALHSETGAVAVDMESHIAAAYAAEAGLPFAALRVIADPASRALPVLAMTAIKPNGEIDLRKVLRSVARNPSSLRALVSTGIDFNRALTHATRLSRLSARWREPRHGGSLTGASALQPRRCTVPGADYPG